MPAQSIPNLPEAIETEKVVLAVLLNEQEAAGAILTLETQDFYIIQHQRIFDAARWCFDHGQEITPMSVYQHLEDNDHHKSVGGLAYLTGLSVPHIYGLETYLGTLRLKSSLRRGIISCHELAGRLAMPGAEAEDIRSAEMVFREVASRAERNAPTLLNLGEEVEKTGGLEKFLRPDRSNMVPTPWPYLNSLLTGGGFLPGQMIVLGARPSLGKSATASLIALGARMRGVAVFSLEMGSRENWLRIIASHANLPLKVVAEGNLDDHGLRQRLHKTTSALADNPLYLDDTTGANVPAIIAAVRKRGGIRLLVVDYLQLLSPLRKRGSRAEDVGEISRALKLAARELKVPVFVLSQLNRETAKNERPPELHDLRDSGAIEQDADVVMFLHADPKEVKAARDDKRPSMLELNVAKQRNGTTGIVRMKFNPANMQIWETELQ
jgi:replicative DNA helicase